MLRLAQETTKASLWGRPSAEFMAMSLAVLLLPVPVMKLRRTLGGMIAVMKAVQILAFKLARASLWPLYLLLLAYAARVAPWPRSLGILVSAVLTAAAIAVFIHEMLRLLTWPPDLSKRLLHLPLPVARQLEGTGRFLVVAAVFSLLPAYIFDHELISPEGRAFTAPALGRLLVIAYELLVWGSFVRLLTGKSHVLLWLATPLASTEEQQSTASHSGASSSSNAAMRIHQGLAWLGRHRRLATVAVLVASASIIVLDIRGYSFTARRLAAGSWQTLLAVGLAVAGYRSIARAIGANAWRWARPSHSWALALTSAMAFRASARSRAAIGGLIAAPEAAADSSGAADDSVPLEDLAAGLRRLSSYAMIGLCLIATAWIWDLDLALVRFLLNKPLWPVDGQDAVTFGNVGEAAIFVLMGALAWRYMSTLFAVTIFPRMPDDPGVRFAVVTLCRYAVLGLTTLGGPFGRASGSCQDRRRSRCPGRRSRLRPPGNRLQLRLRNHSASGTPDPNRRRRHRRGHDWQGRSHQHPSHDDRQRRQPEHDRPQPRVHHRQVSSTGLSRTGSCGSRSSSASPTAPTPTEWSTCFYQSPARIPTFS